jgi:hypothetical protein
MGFFIIAASASATTVYSNNFSTIYILGDYVSESWNNYGRSDYITGEAYSGRFGNQTVTLTLSELPSDSGTINFDLYIIDSWDGDCAGGIGPDTASFHFGAGVTSYTYSNNPGCTQTFYNPGSPAGAGRDASFGSPRDYGFNSISVYSFSLPYRGEAGLATFSFSASGLQGNSDESWGLDNIHVEADTSAVPEPSALALVAGGLGAVGLRLRCRRR